ncbi:Uncharacterized protein OBRU01_20504, partial [Operophtera brumata]
MPGHRRRDQHSESSARVRDRQPPCAGMRQKAENRQSWSR